MEKFEVKKRKRSYYIRYKEQIRIFVLVLVLSFVPLFLNLGSYPLQIWDEARNATNSYEMYKDNDLLIPKFQGYSELWNTKPPLLIWSQWLSFKFFGVSELSVRLPSAIAGFLLFLYVVSEIRKRGYNWNTSILTVVLLIISSGFTGYHCLRTGDYEALLCLFIVIQALTFYNYLLATQDNSRKYFLSLFLVSVVLGVLTKGINALLLMPVFAAYWFFEKMWKREDMPSFLTKTGVAILLAVSYYFIRNWYDPGYIHWVLQNEFGSRFLDVIDQNTHPKSFYLNLFPKQTGIWIYLVIPILVLGLIFGTKQHRKFNLYLFVSSVFYLLIITVAQTKTLWYNVPLIPLSAIILAINLEVVVQRIRRINQHQLQVAHFLVVFGLVVFPYFKVLQKTVNQTTAVSGHEDYYHVTNYLRDLLNSTEKQNITFIDKDYSAHNWWYISRLNDSGHHITHYNSIDSIHPKSNVLIYQNEMFEEIKKNFDFTELQTNPPMKLLRVAGKKSDREQTIKTPLGLAYR